MLEVKLTYPTPDGSEEIPFDGGSLSMGRGSDADLRFDDDGLSRLHATVFREGDKIWVLDEGSTNGTFVNGNPVSPNGTPLRNGDSIKIGHYTNVRVFITERREAQAPVYSKSGNPTTISSSSAESKTNFGLLPIALIVGAVLVIGVSAIFIGVKVVGTSGREISQNNDNTFEEDDPPRKGKTPTPKPTDKTEKNLSPTPAPSGSPASNDKLPVGVDTPGTPPPLSTGKKYQEMSDQERNQYVQVKAEKVAQIIGNQAGEPIPPKAIERIRRDLEGYASRLKYSTRDDCSMGGWLRSDMLSILKRASKNAPVITPAFYEKGMDPQVGLYLAMIESEHCPCLNSNTGPLGIFQFTTNTAKTYFPNDGAGVVRGANANNPDIRCQLEPAAKGSANYMNFLTGYFGTGPQSILLAIGSYNSGEGAGAKNLRGALAANSSQERSFWTLVANSDRLEVQFKTENIRYVPKFFAAAIIGENPQDFGINMLPLSTYTK
jgi:pSer/pThr/pTyr-binding forkhead associated (FHA) protein